MEADDVKSEYKVQSAARRNDYVHQFSEMRRPLSDEEYHTFAKAVNQRIRNNPDQDHFFVPVTYYGDDTKVVLVRRTGDEQFEAYDLYKLNTEMYTGRIVDLLNTLEEVVNEYGSEKFAEWLRSPAYDVFQTFSADTIDKVTNSLNSMTTTERAAKQATLLRALDSNISEADFLKELAK